MRRLATIRAGAVCGLLALAAGTTGCGTERGPAPGASPTDPCRGLALPESEHFVTNGLCARAVATAQGRLRQISFAPNGDLFGVTRQGAVRRYRDQDGNGVFDPGTEDVVDWSHTGGNGNNIHIDAAGGFAYAGSPDGVVRWAYAEDLDRAGPPEDVVVGQPSAGDHALHTVHVYQGWLYVHSGSEGDASAPMSPRYDTERSLLKRFELSKLRSGEPFHWSTDGEVFAVGLRNMVGFTQDAAGRLYGVDNGLDGALYRGEDVEHDNPGEPVVRLDLGSAHGSPFCFTAQRIVLPGGAGVVRPGTPLATEVADLDNPHDDAWCAENARPPETFLQAHSAPLDLAFFDGPAGALPERWRGGAFVAVHGSWERRPSTGYQVLWIAFDAQGHAGMPTSTEASTTFPHEIVFGRGTSAGPVEGQWSWSAGGTGESLVRPVGVAVSPTDGALYVSSDNAPVFEGPEDVENGALYRIGEKRD